MLAMAMAMRSTHAADDIMSEIRATAEQVVKHFDAGQAKELAASFTADGEFIDENGVLLREWRKVKVDGHAREVLASLEEFP